jgi:crotonobetaine/carnitine-CoA ligase
MVAVVVVDGASFDPVALIAFLEPRMPRFMLPRYLDVVDEIPRNSTSLRVQKHVLRDRGVTATTWDREATSSERG